jgi:hypothetical protein
MKTQGQVNIRELKLDHGIGEEFCGGSGQMGRIANDNISFEVCPRR